MELVYRMAKTIILGDYLTWKQYERIITDNGALVLTQNHSMNSPDRAVFSFSGKSSGSDNEKSN